MLLAFRNSWALFLGMFLLMIGNGIQGTLLGIRGNMEGFSTIELSFVMSAYFAGFLGGSQLAPELIRRVGHVRVFAALASFVSAILILYPTITDPWVWVLLRVVFGFCMSGVYVTAESWLNAGTSNDLRGQTLSIYLVVQMAGITVAQALPMLGDPSGFILFVIPSVLVSISFAPILLSVAPTPTFATAKPMGIKRLFRLSPLGCVGVFLMGGVYSAIFGMASVYGTMAGLSVDQIALFIAAIYFGGLVFQFPIGWLSDHVDRRVLILLASVLGAAACVAPLFSIGFIPLLMVAGVIGGVANPLYGLLLAHTNDSLEPDDMASASGQLLFLNGTAAIIGPVATGVALTRFGPAGFFVFILAILAAVALYAAYRMSQRPASSMGHTGDFAPFMATSSLLSMDASDDGAGRDSASAGDDDDEEEEVAA